MPRRRPVHHHRTRLAALVAGAVVVVSAAGCGTAKPASRAAPSTPAPVPTPSAARQREAREATTALQQRGGLIAGELPASYVAWGVECEPRADGIDLVDCSFGQGDGGEDPSFFQVRIQTGGTLTKVLGKPDPVPGTKTSAQTAVLLASDDRLLDEPSRSGPYACTPSPRLDRDGTRAPSTVTGQRCTAHPRIANRDIRRYVEFAADGTVRRDYELRVR